MGLATGHRAPHLSAVLGAGLHRAIEQSGASAGNVQLAEHTQLRLHTHTGHPGYFTEYFAFTTELPPATVPPCARAAQERTGITVPDIAGGSDGIFDDTTVWDNLNVHRDRRLHGFIDAQDWITVHYLPPYAPQLNPVEGVWSLLRRRCQANTVFTDPAHLMRALKRGLREVQYRPALIDGCLAGTGLATAGPDRCL